MVRLKEHGFGRKSKGSCLCEETWEVGHLRMSSNVTLECYSLTVPHPRPPPSALRFFKAKWETCAKYSNSSLEVKNFINRFTVHSCRVPPSEKRFYAFLLFSCSQETSSVLSAHTSFLKPCSERNLQVLSTTMRVCAGF